MTMTNVGAFLIRIGIGGFLIIIMLQDTHGAHAVFGSAATMAAPCCTADNGQASLGLQLPK